MFSKLILVIHRNLYMLNYLQKVFDFPGLEMNFLRARCATLLRDIDDTSADDGVEKIVKKTLVHCKRWSARLLNKSRAVWWFACVILFPFLERENAQELIKIGLDYLGNSLTLDDYSVNFSCEFICQSLVVCQAKMTGEQHEIFVTALKVKLEHASCCGQKTWLINCLICCGCAYDILMPMGTLLSQGDDFAKCIASNIRLVLQHLQADRCSANLFLSIQAGRRQYTSQFRRVPKGSHI